MNRELKVYNQFNELILHLRSVPGDTLPLQVVDGTREMQEAVRALAAHDFDRTVVVNNRHQRFHATWGSPQYIDALAGYWSSNFGWRTRVIDAYLVEFSNVVCLDLVNLLEGTTVTYNNLVGLGSTNIVVSTAANIARSGLFMTGSESLADPRNNLVGLSQGTTVTYNNLVGLSSTNIVVKTAPYIDRSALFVTGIELLVDPPTSSWCVGTSQPHSHDLVTALAADLSLAVATATENDPGLRPSQPEAAAAA